MKRRIPIFRTLAAALALSVVAACAPVAPSENTVEAATCPRQIEGGKRVSNKWGEVVLPQGYETVAGEETWAAAGTAAEPLYMMSVQPKPLEEVVAELEARTGEVFVEVCIPRGRAMLSTPIQTSDGVGSLAVVSANDESSVLIVATDVSGEGRAVRGGLEAVVASFSIIEG